MARPRPVTATVTKPDWMKIHVVRVNTSSLDSSGSTASLVSVLDHDSYDEFENDDYLPGEEASSNRHQHIEQISDESLRDCNDTGSTDKVHSEHRTCIRTQSSVSDTLCSSSFEDMTPWEKWLLEKVKQERASTRKQSGRNDLEKISQLREEQVKREKRMKDNLVLYKWLEEKNMAEKIRLRQEKQKTEELKQQEALKKLEINEKANKKFDEWIQQKRVEERLAKRAEAERKKEEVVCQAQRQKVAEKKYKDWYRKVAKSGNKPATQSMGYISGKLTDYHDKNAYPPPTFFNPIPWKPLKIPQQKTEKKTEKKTKRRTCSNKR